MKRIFYFLTFFAAILSARAQVTFSNSPVYGAISGTPAAYATNVGAWVLVGTATIASPPVYSLSHSGLTATSDITNIIQLSFGGTNSPVTITNIIPAITNLGAADSYSMPKQTLQVYSRVLVVGTNSVSGGAQMVFGTSALH